MSWLAAPLGIVAALAMSAPLRCPGGPELHKAHHEPERSPPDQPSGCHANLGCAEHRRVKTLS
nr:hypothetical protein [Sphingomonas sp.]